MNEFITAVSVKQRIMACLSVFIKKALPPGGMGRQSSDPSRKSYDGKTLTEIAQMMGLSYGAVKLRHQNALIMLKKYMSE